MPPLFSFLQKDSPPVMRRGLWWLMGMSACFVLGPIAWMVLRGPLGVPQGFAYRHGALVLMFVPSFVILPLWMLRVRSIHRALLESEGRLCTHCAYDVSSLARSGMCPECGKAYDIEKDKVLWEVVGARFANKGDARGALSTNQGDSGRPPR